MTRPSQLDAVPNSADSTVPATGAPVRRRDLRADGRRRTTEQEPRPGAARAVPPGERAAASPRTRARGSTSPARSRSRRVGLGLTRAALAGALVVSITAFAYGRPGEATPTAAIAPGPTTIEALTRPGGDATIPAGLAGRSAPHLKRASRSGARDALPGCSGIATGLGQNGRLAASELCDLWQRPYQDRADAVVTIAALNDAYKARFGTDMCLSSGYRDLEVQAALRTSKGSLAAPAGQSNHGWGLAVDFCSSTYTGRSGAWLDQNGPIFGWANPAWAHRGGGGPFEPWHWEFVSGVAKMTSSAANRSPGLPESP
jgi:D-alanyl-D-alanine carboxypeptidase